jgi:L-rhamnose isomerase
LEEEWSVVMRIRRIAPSLVGLIALKIQASFNSMKVYADLGIDPNKAVEAALQVPISMHCWQADDVAGLESGGSAADSGGIKSTGNYPGKARNGDEMRMDFEKVLSLVPGVHRVNIHAFYAEPGNKKVDRDDMELSHFQNWMDWAKGQKISLDFNPTYFAHPKSEDRSSDGQGAGRGLRQQPLGARWAEGSSWGPLVAPRPINEVL